MRKVILYIAVSLDHYIARKDGAVDWLDNTVQHIENEDYGYHTFYNSIDTTLMGRKTFNEVLGFDVPFPYPDKKNFVFTKDKNFSHEHAEVVNNNAAAFVQSLKSKPGKDIWLIGGGQLNTTLAKAGLIDEMMMTVFPVLLGEGIPLFLSHQTQQSFTLKNHQAYSNHIIKLHYQKTTE